MAVAAVARWGVAPPPQAGEGERECAICYEPGNLVAHQNGNAYHTFHKKCLLESDLKNPQLGCPLCKLPHDFSALPTSPFEILERIGRIFEETARQTLSLFWNYLQEASLFSALGCVVILAEINLTLPCIGGVLFGAIVGTFVGCALQAFVGDFLHLLADRWIEKLSPHPLVRIIFRIASAALSVALTYFLCSHLFWQTFHLLDTYLSSRSIEVLSSQDLFLVASLVGTVAGGIGTLFASLFKWTDRLIQLPEPEVAVDLFEE